MTEPRPEPLQKHNTDPQATPTKYYYLYRQLQVSSLHYHPPAKNIAILASTPREANHKAQKYGLRFLPTDEPVAESQLAYWTKLWEKEENLPNRYDIFATKEELVEECETIQEEKIPSLLIIEE